MRYDGIAALSNACSVLANYLEGMWTDKTPQQAHEILEKDDVLVTNGGDKEVQLKKVLALHGDIIKAGAARMSWCADSNASAGPDAGSGAGHMLWLKGGSGGLPLCLDHDSTPGGHQVCERSLGSVWVVRVVRVVRVSWY
mmetsp:Transcript_26393/g.45133  ORF Transcript_26393/g.45133 Transcript_26393/m.45133 type:complete len:140 (+) Transcript_26393:1127-1546(+)